MYRTIRNRRDIFGMWFTKRSPLHIYSERFQRGTSNVHNTSGEPFIMWTQTRLSPAHAWARAPVFPAFHSYTRCPPLSDRISIFILRLVSESKETVVSKCTAIVYMPLNGKILSEIESWLKHAFTKSYCQNQGKWLLHNFVQFYEKAFFLLPIM